ncbi:response regulator [Polyangium aurulentum]|uniref:response regulator n=1 Tax=Polyangium aurulentum TaxID=2567896 RepID=UPI00146D7978|nr:response regulator [Polyangium aurulentum]UQA55483.1 response regulator [Polyangium aurulentum]
MPRVLVVDDDASYGARAVQILQDAGFQARFHRGPFGSLHAIRETNCDVLLLDVNMPKLDGPQLVRMIQQAFGARRPEMLLYSNMSLGILERIAGAIGAQGAVPKDATPEEMVARVQRALAKRGGRHGLPRKRPAA